VTTVAGKATGAATTVPLIANKANPILRNTLKNFGVGALALLITFILVFFLFLAVLSGV
jgi:hypothetical protein